MSSNPYQAPRTAVAAGPHGAPRAIELAGKWRRFFTLLVDYVCYIALCLLLGIAVGVLFGRRGVQAMNDLGLWMNAISLGLMLAYYIVFEAVWARTPGKWVCGTVVVDEDGGPPSFGQAVGRSFCRLIPFDALSIFSERCWHDRFPRTHVVMAR